MGDKAMREIHIRVSTECYDQLEAMALENEVSVATVCRQALRHFLRNRSPGPRGKSEDKGENQ
jgi:predicted transcriptional regulator